MRPSSASTSDASDTPTEWYDEFLTHAKLAIDQGRPNWYAQTGEDGILSHIFKNIGVTNTYLVDLGAGDGFNLSNTRHFIRNRWTGLLIDGGGPHKGVVQEWITADEITETFERHEVPEDFDLLSLDLDGQDYWVLLEILRDYTPRVIVCEFNPSVAGAVTVPKDPKFEHDATTYYGASFQAFRDLCHSFGYTLVHNHWERNLFFILEDLIPGVQPRVQHRQTQHHAPDTLNRPWIKVYR